MRHVRHTMFPKRSPYISLLGLTIALGLLSRSALVHEESIIREYAGDALWALAVFWTLAAIFPRGRTAYLVIGSLVISFGVEISQLYHAQWIDHLRSYRLGALLLGSSFRWIDLACYAAGIWLGSHLDYYHLKRQNNPGTDE